MKLTVANKDLARVIGAVGKVVESRRTIPILGMLLLSASIDADGTGKLSVTGTDLDIVVSDTIPAEVEQEGTTCVDAKLLGDIARKANGGVSISHANGQLTVKSGRSAFTLQTLSPADFPTLNESNYYAHFETDLATLFAPCAFAISTEETRYYLNGIYLHTVNDALVAVATDGHRLARNNGVNVPHFEGIIVPRKTVGILPKGVVSVSVSANKIRIGSGDFIIVSKLIDGTFPDYQRVIPASNDKKITFASEDMKQAAGRVAVISSERGRAVRLSFTDDAVVLAVNNPASGSASDEVSVTYGGEPIEIGFNAAYLAELVGIFPAGDVQLALADSGSPALFTSEKAEGLLCVLMPCRV